MMALFKGIGRFFLMIWFALDAAHALRHGSVMSPRAMAHHQARRDAWVPVPADPLSAPLVRSRPRCRRSTR